MVPELTLGWRLRMARELTGMGVKEFAAHIGVANDTVTSAEHDRRKVRAITLNAYVLATGVSREWLEQGTGSPKPTPPDGGGEDHPDTSDAVAKLAATKRNSTHRRTTGRYLTPAVAA